MTTAYNPESMVNLKAAPETVDRTVRVTYRGLCAPQGVPPSLRDSPSLRVGTGQGVPEPIGSPTHQSRAPSWWLIPSQTFFPQPANFPHADRHPSEATHRGAATALPQSTLDHRPDLKQDTGFGPRRSNCFGLPCLVASSTGGETLCPVPVSNPCSGITSFK